MALGFANVDYAIKTRLIYNLSEQQKEVYENFIKTHKIKAKYEKLGILNILAFNGYPLECLCTRTKKALKNLKNRGLICVNMYDICHLTK